MTIEQQIQLAQTFTSRLRADLETLRNDRGFGPAMQVRERFIIREIRRMDREIENLRDILEEIQLLEKGEKK